MLSSTELLDCLQAERAVATQYLPLLPLELQNNLRARNSVAALSPRSRAKRDENLVAKTREALGEESFLQLINMITAFRASEDPDEGSHEFPRPQPPGPHEQDTGRSIPAAGGMEDPEMSAPELVSRHHCYFCTEKVASKLVFCSDCRCVYCFYDWPRQPFHNTTLQSSHLHRQIDLSIYDWVQATINANVQSGEQQRLHCEDLNSLWFGLNVDDESVGAKFINTDVYGDLIAASTYPDKTQQFPSLVSFVGPTGAGKSTLIKGLITLDRGEEELPTPVPGNDQNLGNPTSGDVHLYADPSTLHVENPMLFVDCEGLDGGNHAPGAIKSRTGLNVRTTLREYWRTMRDREFFLPNVEGYEGYEGGKPTRKFCVEDLYPRIIYAFSDVICFVTERANTAEVTIERLIKWADKVLTKTVNQPSLPRAIIVANGMKNNPAEWLDEEFATNAMLKDAKNMRLLDPEIRAIEQSWREKLPNGRTLNSLYDLLRLYFEDICVVYIPLKQGSAPDVIYQQYQQLRRRIETECERIQTKKDQSWNRLNTTELDRFFNGAFEHFLHNLDEPFDFFKFSQKNNPVPVAFDQHASNLMRKMQEHDKNVGDLDSRIASILASCICLGTLDAENFRFPPERIVGEYQKLCESAYLQFYDLALCAYTKDGRKCVNVRNSHEKGHQDPSGEIFDQGDYMAPNSRTTLRTFWSKISASYAQTAKELRHLKNSTEWYTSEVIKRHRKVLLEEKNFWKSTISHVTCFICVLRHPDNVLPCGHAICENCIKRFGVRNTYDPSVFELASCSLCQRDFNLHHTPLELQLKPDDSGVRILCIDGGGIRGVIACKILELLEDEIGLSIPIHEFFDYIGGAGTGGVIALGLGRNLWSAQTCLPKFKDLAENAFTRHAGTWLPIFGWIVACWNESFYRTPDLEAQLQSAFQYERAQRTLFGDDYTGPFAAVGKERTRVVKISVPASTAFKFNQEAYLITNYNRKKNTDGIKMYRQDDPRNEMDVWEAARCTSAAPLIFQKFEAPNGQHFQGGGLKHNNTVKVATEEADFIWPDSSQLDYLLTIGTGYTDKPPTSTDLPDIVPGFWRRLFTNFKHSFETEIIWREHKSSIDADRLLNRYHRLNLWQPCDTLPDLDDVSRIADLEISTNEAFYRGKPARRELRKAANALLAGIFYFRVESISRAAEHSYYVNGTLICRLEKHYHVKVVTELFMRNAYFSVAGDSRQRAEMTPFMLDAVRRGDSYFQVPIDYTVPSLSEKTSIYLVLDADTLRAKDGVSRHHISGSPLGLERHQNLVSDTFSPLTRNQRSSSSVLSTSTSSLASGEYTPSCTETATSA